MANIICKKKSAALNTLDTIVTSMKGLQREAVLAVRSWIDETFFVLHPALTPPFAAMDESGNAAYHLS
jgi:hypothetical protein